MAEKVVISGGSGFIGEHLTDLLLAEGYEVSWLSRNPDRNTKKGVNILLWNPETGSIQQAALQHTDYLVHLAGANIGEQRWTEGRKAEITQSRIQTTQTLVESLKLRLQTGGGKIKAVISASAIGLYGSNKMPNDEFTEESEPGTGFQAEVSVAWEKSLAEFENLAERVLKYRFAVVLGNDGGAFPKMIEPVKFGIGTIGKGHQILSWVHIDDVCQSILFAIRNQGLAGAYNIVAPNVVTNAEFTKTAAHLLHRFTWLPAVPEFLVKLAVGEMSELVTSGSRVSGQKLLNAGYKFKFPDMESALTDLMGKHH